MCGIVGIVGKTPVALQIVEALKRLEYRGYDSAGVATLEDGRLDRRRAEGKLRNLETALMLLQVRTPRLIWGALLGLAAAGGLALAWGRFGHLINVKRFFQVTGIFLLLFMIQVGIYSFHEFAEAGLLPNSDFLHEATEKLSPDGLYGKWFSVVMVAVCGLWLFVGWLMDRVQSTSRRGPAPLAEAGH